MPEIASKNTFNEVVYKNYRDPARDGSELNHSSDNFDDSKPNTAVNESP